MTCAEAAEQILEADRLELEGMGESMLARHLKGCSRCRAMALAVVRGEDSLAEEMAAVVPMPDLDALLDENGRSKPERTERIRIKARRFGLGLLPLAAAAAFASLFLSREPQVPGDSYSPPAFSPGLGLEVPEGRNVAVLATKNPNITVLWFF